MSVTTVGGRPATPGARVLVSHCLGTTRPSGPTASHATGTHARSSIKCHLQQLSPALGDAAACVSRDFTFFSESASFAGDRPEHTGNAVSTGRPAGGCVACGHACGARYDAVAAAVYS